MAHLPECTALTLAEAYPGESKPEELSEAAWTEVAIARCAPDCPELARDIERGKRLAREHGW
jgi:hypothetical protein